MGSRTLPTECPHGKTLDWGDFGPDPDDGSVAADSCAICEPGVGIAAERDRYKTALRKIAGAADALPGSPPIAGVALVMEQIAWDALGDDAG